MTRHVITAALALFCGLLIVGAFAAQILWLTNDMRYALLLGAVGLFGSAALIGGLRRGDIVSLLLLGLPLIVLFGLEVVPELPGLWPHMIFWGIFAALGWAAFRFGRKFTQGAIVATLAVSILAGWYGLSYVPGSISESLSKTVNEPAPDFALVTLEGAPIGRETFENKVVVLDYFATWCAPCVLELPELNAIHQRYADAQDVVMLVVANDSGNDTPESIRTFVERRSLQIPFTYDPEGLSHKAFGFAGLPGLLVIDRTDKVRFKREGYNAAEEGFADNLVEIIESLRAETQS